MSKVSPYALALLATLAAPCAAAEPVTQTGETQDSGLKLRWEVTQPGNADDLGFGIVDIRVSDAVTGSPTRYKSGQILGWMQHETGALIEEQKTCEEKIRNLATQGVGRKSSIDLNQYRIITINRDGSIAFINPFVGMSNAKLETILELHAEPLDWVQISDRMELWILAKDAEGVRTITVVDLLTRQRSRKIELPVGNNADALVLDETSGDIWLSMPGLSQVARFAAGDTSSRNSTFAAPGATTIYASKGSAAFWSDTQRRLVWLNGKSKNESWQISAEPVLVSPSVSAQANVIVASDGGIYLAPLGQSEAGPKRVLKINAVIGAATLIDNGRRLLLAGDGKAHLVDLATLAVTDAGSVETGATNFIQTESFVYAVGSPTGRVTLFDIAGLRSGTARPVSAMVMAADASPNKTAKNFIPSPDGSGLLAASARDGMIFQYVEGMMAPVGSFSNYRRAAAGLAIADYAFHEVAPGHYRASFRAQQGGRYQLLVGAISPRVSSCSEIGLRGDDGKDEPAAQLSASLSQPPQATIDGARVAISIREQLPKLEPKELGGLADVVLLVFDKQSGWQRRVRMSETIPGEYVGTVSVPKRGLYELQVSSISANLSFIEGRLGGVQLERRP